MSNECFGLYGDCYDLLYSDKDYKAETAYVAHALRTNGAATTTLLEFGSGTGRHGQLLAGQGFDVHGIERSEAMVAAAKAARRAGGKFDCCQGDIRTKELDRTFDAVISLFHVVSYQTQNSDLTQTFANAARHLKPSGIFLFDVWHGPAVLHVRPSVRIKRVESESTRLLRIAEPELDTNASVVTVRYTMLAECKTTGKLTRFTEEHRMRYFFPTEVKLLASQCGFAIERSEEFLTGHVPSENTWGVTYILRKLG